MAMKEHKVGERFESCKLIYEVRESMSCAGCSFMYEDEGECMARTTPIENCSDKYRKDGKRVIFVQVGEVEE